MMSISRYRIEERAEVMRVYEIDATSEDAAIELTNSGTVQPKEAFDIDSAINVRKISAQKVEDDICPDNQHGVMR